MTPSEAPEDDGTRTLANLLVTEREITSAEFEEAAAAQAARGGRIIDALLALGIVSPGRLATFIEEHFGYNRIEVASLEIPQDVLELVPAAFALEHDLVPLDVLGRTLTVAMVYPVDKPTLSALADMTGLKPKPLLCAADDVRACLHRYYEDGEVTHRAPAGIEGPLKLTSAVELLRGIDALPALPGTVREVREMVYEHDASAREVGDVIARDPAIAAKVLRLANSPAYGFPRRVDNIQLAVTLLGLEEIYSVVLSTAVINLFDKSRAMDYVAFWMESMVCGSFARALAKAFGAQNYTGIVTAGLLHEIGRPALAEVSPRLFNKVERGLTGQRLVEAEQQVIGLSHLEAGYQLAIHWDLPEDLAEIIRFHPTPHHAREDLQELTALINVADVAARAHRPDAESREPDLTDCAPGLDILERTESEVLETLKTVPDIERGRNFWSPN